MEYADLLNMEYLAKKYDETNIPLYLSYPTTSWWKAAADERSLVESFEREESPFLYFHFPYCKSACYYCCCYKEVTASDDKKETYIRYLEKEFLKKLSVLHVDRFEKVRHLHWGGGTPTYLSCSQIENFFTAMAKKAMPVDAADSSISIEAFPDDEVLTPEKLRLIRGLGFNEISFGIQDFDERIQKTINRNCKVETVKKIAAQAKEMGFRLHFDLCYGLPFQGIHELEGTIHHIMEMSPDRIAVFPYAHYPLMFPLQRRIPASSIPNSFMKVLLIRRAGELFASHGYEAVGIDHFVKPDNPLYRASRENKVIKDFMGYSVEQRRSFIGFGSSAISYLGNTYFHNAVSQKEYYAQLDGDRLPFGNGMAHHLTRDDVIRNRIIQKSILCDSAIDKKELGGLFEIDFDDYFKKELALLKDYEKDGLVESVDGDRIAITRMGKYMARHIAFVFDRYYG